MKLLKCLEHCHSSQTSQVLKLLIPDLLRTTPEAISRQAANLSCRKIELLLTMPAKDITKQFSKEDLLYIQERLNEFQLVQK